MMREELAPVLIGYRATSGTSTVVPQMPLQATKAGRSSQRSSDGPIMVHVRFFISLCALTAARGPNSRD